MTTYEGLTIGLRPPAEATDWNPVPAAPARASSISIIEADPVTRQILSHWIGCAPGFRCLSSYAETDSALRHLTDENPDMLLASLNLRNAVERIRRLKSLLPETCLVMMTVFENTDRIVEALAAGATCFLPKYSPRHELIRTLDEVRRGVPPMSSDIARQILRSLPPALSGSNASAGLTALERDILKALANGDERKEIAAELGVSASSVNASLRGIYRKLQAQVRPPAPVPARRESLSPRAGCRR